MHMEQLNKEAMGSQELANVEAKKETAKHGNQ